MREPVWHYCKCAVKSFEAFPVSDGNSLTVTARRDRRHIPGSKTVGEPCRFYQAMASNNLAFGKYLITENSGSEMLRCFSTDNRKATLISRLQAQAPALNAMGRLA